MKQHLCRVIENRILWADVQLLVFDAPELAHAIRPGQFALARDPNTLDPYLRRTLWLFQIEGARVAFTLSSRDALAVRARAGDVFDLLAPLGRAIEFDVSARHVLLIGEGMRVVNLIAIAHDAVANGREVVLVAPSPVEDGAQAGQGVGVSLAHLLSPEIEYRMDDGMNPEVIAWADAIVASGSPELYRALSDAIRAARYRLESGFARGLIDLPMPCGTGLCYACAVDTSRGVKLTCVEGPAFDLGDFENRRAR